MIVLKLAMRASRINFLVMRKACGGCMQIRRARSSAAAGKASSATTAETRPQSPAVVASINSPVKNNCVARDQPMVRGNRPSLRNVAPRRRRCGCRRAWQRHYRDRWPGR